MNSATVRMSKQDAFFPGTFVCHVLLLAQAGGMEFEQNKQACLSPGVYLLENRVL